MDEHAKLKFIERQYVEVVLEIEAALEPHYKDKDVRRTIAESSDTSRNLYREILTLQAICQGRAVEKAALYAYEKV